MRQGREINKGCEGKQTCTIDYRNHPLTVRNFLGNDNGAKVPNWLTGEDSVRKQEASPDLTQSE